MAEGCAFSERGYKSLEMRGKRKLKILAYTLGILSLLLLACLITLYIQVSRDASDRIERGVIDSITFSESPVYYEDGETPIGVFFDRIHSRHIAFEEAPKMFVKALIAAEDKRFFDHPGFDIRAIISLDSSVRRNCGGAGGAIATAGGNRTADQTDFAAPAVAATSETIAASAYRFGDREKNRNGKLKNSA